MPKYISIIFVGVFTSFYFFPFEFTFLPGINTKLILAILGAILFFVNMARQGESLINKNFFITILLACGVSLASLFSMVINGTYDDTYVSYIISMLVWTYAAYLIICLIKNVHSKVTVEIICFYLIGVCSIQCILAILIDTYPVIKSLVSSFLWDFTGFKGIDGGRLYGIGSAVDIAGTRFSCVLLMIAVLLPHILERKKRISYIVFLLIAFFIISIIGNMIGRTTTVGLVLSLLYLLFSIIFGDLNSKNRLLLIKWISIFLFLFIIVSCILYFSDLRWKYYFEFGFEGFFSLFTKGKWEVHSNEMLFNHFVFPDNIRCWLIGDGYFSSPNNDPSYIGPIFDYYMGTDVGYCRFIFYFGLIGLSIFSLFMCKVCSICVTYFNEYKWLFIGVLAINFIVWFKVSTDIFIVFAPFLALNMDGKCISNK